MTKHNNISITRSSAAEFLTYIASVGEQDEAIEIRYEDENVWLTQKKMAELYNVSVAAINQHVSKIYADGELDKNSTIKKYLIVQTHSSQAVYVKL